MKKALGIQRHGRLLRAGQMLIICLGRGPTDVYRYFGGGMAEGCLSGTISRYLRNFEEGSLSSALVDDFSKAEFR